MSYKDKESCPRGNTSSKRKNHVQIGSELESNGDSVVQAMTGSLNTEDIRRITSMQNKSLKSFVKTNEMLGKFNDFSSSKYDVLQHMFMQHTRLLTDLRNDLTNVFQRIRRLKVRLQSQYPAAFEATFNLRQDLENRLEEEDPSVPTYVSGEITRSPSENEQKQMESPLLDKRTSDDDVNNEHQASELTDGSVTRSRSASEANSDIDFGGASAFTCRPLERKTHNYVSASSSEITDDEGSTGTTEDVKDCVQVDVDADNEQTVVNENCDVVVQPDSPSASEMTQGDIEGQQLIDNEQTVVNEDPDDVVVQPDGPSASEMKQGDIEGQLLIDDPSEG